MNRPPSRMRTPEPQGGETVGTQSTLSPKKVSRLRRFAHMIGQADEMENYLKEGAELTLKAAAVDGSRAEDVYPITDETVHIIRKAAFNMYRDELSQQPDTKEAADAILAERKRLRKAEEDKKHKDEHNRWKAMWSKE